MKRETVVLPATRIPRSLWRILEEVMKRKMFTSKAELVKDALREYALRHKEEVGRAEFSFIDASIILEKGRAEDLAREEKLLEWVEKLRPRQ